MHKIIFGVKALSYLNKYLAQHRGALLWGTLFTVVANVLAMLPPRLVRYAFDVVQVVVMAPDADEREGLHRRLLLCGGGIVLLAALKGLFTFLSRCCFTVMGKRIEYALKNDIYRHYQTLPLSFYRRHSTGDLMARISEDVDRVGMYVGPSLMYVVSSTVTFLLIVPYMWMLNAELALYAAVPIPFLAAGTYYVSTFLHRRSQAIQEQLSRLTTFVQESFSGVRVLQAFACERAFVDDFAQVCAAYRARALRLTQLNAFFFPAVVGIIGAGVLVVVFLGGRAVMEGRMSPGGIAEFIMYLYLLGWPIFSVSWVMNFVQKAAASQQRINEFLQVKNPIVSVKALERPMDGRLTLQDVSFTYPDSGIRALQGVSLEVAPGASLAIVGPTGSGKTTLANLLCRLYDADEGVVMVDGVPIQDYAVPCLRRQLGYVPQDVFLFADSIEHNIAFGATGATRTQVVAAAELAGIYGTIQQLPDGLQTVVGERGVTLSGGQKQRISIARAFVRDPRILVLDDCLSAVDVRTEQGILQTMARVMQGRTTIIISHRVAAARLAEHIVVLDEGRVAEQGDHVSLLARRGTYHALYEKQHDS